MADTETSAKPNRAPRRAAASEAKASSKGAANARGFVTFAVSERTYRAQLRMNTLADIEDAFGVANTQELARAMDAWGTREVGKLLAFLVNAAEGEGTVTADECRRWPISIAKALKVYFDCLRAVGGETDEEADAAGK